MNRQAHWALPAILAWAAIVVLLEAGCTRSPAPVGSASVAPGAAPQQDHLKLALDYLGRLDEFDPQKGMVQTAYYLNRWIEDLDEQTTWRPTPMIEGLPRELRAIAPVRELAKREFTTEDVLFLREASWSESLSEWVSQQRKELGIERWLDQIEKARGEPHAYELEVAARLFDWTVRNIQLDELLDYPAPAAGPASDSDEDAGRPIVPIARAVPGPGYTAYPWQTLLFGHGDAWQRARVFILLARQQQIDVVMLAFDDPRQMPRPRPWLPAALIDGELYLFDTALGLPIPGPDGVGIATLGQVRKDPSLLRRLDVGEANRYAAADADLDRVVALVHASPEALSMRMSLIESHATTGQPLALSIDADALADELRRCEGVSDVQLWRAAFETWMYRKALERRAQEDVDLMRRLILDEWIFDGLNPMVQGRQLHFRGKFDTEDHKKGAKAYYLQARVPNVIIDQIATSPEVQRSMGIFRRRENDQQWQAKLELQKVIATRVKQNCSYWLGLIHYETGRYAAAKEWLQRRVLDAYEDGPWTPGARYNLARVYEAMGKWEQARKLLLLDDSPQKHGSLLRARYLRKKLESQAANAKMPTR